MNASDPTTPTALLRSRTGRGKLSRRAAFAVLTAATVSLMAAASAPSPLYPAYRERWGFSVAMLTIVFAVYAAGLLSALLTVGSLSDQLGRRPVLVAALLIAAVSTAILWTADGLGALLTARLVQGVASGTAMSSLAAGLLDLSSARRPQFGATVTAIGTSIGLALGAGVVGLLLEWTAYPDHYAFPLFTAVFHGLAGLVLALPESVPPHAFDWTSLRPKINIDAAAHATFWATAPSTIAGWAATGLFLALVPSLVHEVLHVGSAAIGGLSVATLYLAVTAGGAWAGRWRLPLVTRLGSILLGGGAIVLLLAIAADSVDVFTVGSLAIGIGVGLTFNGNFRAVGAATSAKTRSATFAAVYLISYTSLSVPTLVAGIAERRLGLKTTTYAYLAFIALLALIAAGTRGRKSAIPVHAEADPPRPGGELLIHCYTDSQGEKHQ